MDTLELDPLYRNHGPTETITGDAQCDQWRRDAHARAGRAQEEAQLRLVMKLAPFVYLEDEKLQDNAAFADAVARRLTQWALTERARRIAVCPEGFEHLVPD